MDCEVETSFEKSDRQADEFMAMVVIFAALMQRLKEQILREAVEYSNVRSLVGKIIFNPVDILKIIEGQEPDESRLATFLWCCETFDGFRYATFRREAFSHPYWENRKSFKRQRCGPLLKVRDYERFGFSALLMADKVDPSLFARNDFLRTFIGRDVTWIENRREDDDLTRGISIRREDFLRLKCPLLWELRVSNSLRKGSRESSAVRKAGESPFRATIENVD